MAPRKIQYPSVSKVINVPVSYPVVPGGDFCDFDLVLKPKSIQLGSFNNLVVVPTPYPVVTGGDFPKFDLVQKPKPTQLGSFTNTVYLPVAAPVFQPYVFTQFDQPQPRKGFTYSFDDGWTGTGTPAQNFVFTTFSQPIVVKPQQEEWIRFEVLPSAPAVFIQPYLFSEFNQPKLIAKIFQENTFNDYEAVANNFFPAFSVFDQPRFKQVRQDPEVQFTIFPITQVVSTPVFTGFTDFGIPVTRKIQQPDISGTLQQQVVAVIQPYVFGQFSQPQFVKSPQPGFSNTIQPASIQTYIFSTFSQPLIKRQVNDQPTWFGSSAVLQPYVFSAFSQPRPLKYQTDANIQTSYYPIVVIPPPNFTGFNDFGLPQQLLGTQQKQDGGYIQFTVLPMPQVISPYFFTGFSSFQELLPNTTDRQRGLIGLGSSFDNVIIPVVQIPPPDVIVGGGGYRFMGGYHKYDKPQTIHTDAVRKAAAVLSKMGGEARAKSLTPTQRSNIASTAANTRWNPKK